MNRFPGGQGRRFLFRSYLLLAGSLLLVALVLDYGFGRLQSAQYDPDEQWLAATFDLIERELLLAPSARRDEVARALAADIGIGVAVLERDDVHLGARSSGGIPALVDSDGNTSYLREAASIDRIIRLGPVGVAQQSVLLRLLPPLFYFSIFIVVGVWLRPLLRDINLVTRGAQRFAADYREPLQTSGQTTELTGLAANLDDMSARLSGLIQSQKELIAALSHEMRTPLARIRFGLAVIGNKTGAELKQPLEDVDRDVQEIDELIASMLNYARLDHPDLRMNWQQVPVDAWLEQTLDKCRPAERTIDIVAGDSIESAWMDARLMTLALSNLLVNACRYAEQRVNCALVPDDIGYAIRVEDDGEGIPEEKRDAIFKAFARIDGSRSRDTGGYGLGLAIVARIAALHGGDVSAARSETLGGASFTLRWRPPSTVRSGR